MLARRAGLAAAVGCCFAAVLSYALSRRSISSNRASNFARSFCTLNSAQSFRQPSGSGSLGMGHGETPPFPELGKITSRIECLSISEETQQVPHLFSARGGGNLQRTQAGCCARWQFSVAISHRRSECFYLVVFARADLGTVFPQQTARVCDICHIEIAIKSVT
jgi:hypothetical protein